MFLIPARTDTRWFHEVVFRRANENPILVKDGSSLETLETAHRFPSVIVNVQGDITDFRRPFDRTTPPLTAGLLDSPDLVTWLGYGLVLLLAALCMPTGVRESLRQLWEPVNLFLARLHVSLLVGWCFPCHPLRRVPEPDGDAGYSCSDD